MAPSESGVEQLPVEVKIGLGIFFLFALVAMVIMRNPRADLADAIRQDP